MSRRNRHKTSAQRKRARRRAVEARPAERPSWLKRYWAWVNTKDEGRKSGYFSQPIAPVGKGTVLLVTLAAAVLLMPIASISIELLAVFGCVLVLLAALAITDVLGRRKAAQKPHPLYSAALPEDSWRMKAFLWSCATAVLLVLWTFSLDQKKMLTPWPYFMIALFLTVVVPQIQAWRAVKLYDRKQGRS